MPPDFQIFVARDPSLSMYLLQDIMISEIILQVDVCLLNFLLYMYHFSFELLIPHYVDSY